jgi:hypothetical protein
MQSDGGTSSRFSSTDNYSSVDHEADLNAPASTGSKKNLGHASISFAMMESSAGNSNRANMAEVDYADESDDLGYLQSRLGKLQRNEQSSPGMSPPGSSVTSADATMSQTDSTSGQHPVSRLSFQQSQTEVRGDNRNIRSMDDGFSPNTYADSTRNTFGGNTDASTSKRLLAPELLPQMSFQGEGAQHPNFKLRLQRATARTEIRLSLSLLMSEVSKQLELESILYCIYLFISEFSKKHSVL